MKLQAGGLGESWGGVAGLKQVLTAQEFCYDRRSLETLEHTAEECQLLVTCDLPPLLNQWCSKIMPQDSSSQSCLPVCLVGSKPPGAWSQQERV